MVNNSPPAPLSRYQRVKNILNAAQGDQDVSYQGYGRFWELPLAQFLTATIYGVPLIAPSPTGTATGQSASSACACRPNDQATGCACETPTAAPPRSPGRGAASGLIKGLRGEAPFDGTQFPPLLWGPTATPVSAADIQLIADWIDDGCPEQDEPATAQAAHYHTQRVNLALGHVPHPLTVQPINAHKGSPGHLKVRKNIESLTRDELARFRAALAQMQSLDRQYPHDERSFAYWARMHADMCQHGWEQFATWHRAYLYFFEQRLQDIDPSVTLPYWDWTLYADQNKAAASKNLPAPKDPQPAGQKQFSHDSGIIPAHYGCWIDAAGLANLKGRIDAAIWNKLNKIKGKAYLSGNRLYTDAGIDYQGTASSGSAPTRDDLIMNELQRSNPLWHRQRWPGMNASLITHYPTAEDVQRILATPNFAYWGGGPASDHFFGALESVHNYIHNFSGGLNPNYMIGNNPEFYSEPLYGHMQESRTTAFDPIFWAHHANVDRLFAQWQELHPGLNPQVSNSPLSPFEMTVADSLSIHNLGYEYVQDAYHFPTDPGLGIKRFRSEPVTAPAHVLDNHRRVEVRLHGVQVAQRGANIRVFLNQEATVDTPVERNRHYVGNFVSFVGFCYGGPGHCDPPPSTRRPFDHRSRHHKTPGNLRFDATETVRQLRNGWKKKKDPFALSVHLVVTDMQGHVRDDLLKLDGVSIHFVP